MQQKINVQIHLYFLINFKQKAQSQEHATETNIQQHKYDLVQKQTCIKLRQLDSFSILFNL